MRLILNGPNYLDLGLGWSFLECYMGSAVKADPGSFPFIRYLRVGVMFLQLWVVALQLLIACLDDKTARDEGTNVDPKMAEEDAKQLYKDGEKIWGTNKKTFVEIFTKRNRPQLAAVDVAYEKLYGRSLEEVRYIPS